jgi:hypothetical protein
MEYALIALILKPLFSLFLFGGVSLSIRWAINNWMPEGRIKTLLLKHRGGTKDSLCR